MDTRPVDEQVAEVLADPLPDFYQLQWALAMARKFQLAHGAFEPWMLSHPQEGA